MLYQVHIADLVPADNFYRKLSNAVDLNLYMKKPQNIMAAKDRKASTLWYSLKYAWLVI